MHPVGPLPPRVYWTRRAVLLAGLLVLVIAVAVSCSGGSSKPHPSAAKPPTKPRPTTSATAAPAACRNGQLTVTASTDATTYPSGALPRLQVSVRNSGTTPCVLTESPRTRSWTIVSGTDQIWSTVGCQASATAHSVTLKPGAASRHTVVWNRHRSGKACATSTVEAAAGTYQLTVSVNGITSATAVFHLTG